MFAQNLSFWSFVCGSLSPHHRCEQIAGSPRVSRPSSSSPSLSLPLSSSSSIIIFLCGGLGVFCVQCTSESSSIMQVGWRTCMRVAGEHACSWRWACMCQHPFSWFSCPDFHCGDDIWRWLFFYDIISILKNISGMCRGAKTISFMFLATPNKQLHS